jgi:hypothetical protein
VEAGVNLDEPLRTARAWLARRSPRWIVFAGWIAFGLCCYPGYLSYDSIEQLGEARNHTYSDAYAPVMTWLWSLCEYVVAGPAGMLALQSGLFLFGLRAVLARVLSPRAAALAACGVLLAPPVFSVMAVIWPESLMAGALLAAAACLLHERRGWRVAGVVALAVACGCRWELAPAALPIAALAFARIPRARRFGAALGLALGCTAAARLASCAIVDHPSYALEQRLELVDVAGTARRARLSGPALDAAFAGLAVTDRAQLDAWIAQGRDVYDAFSLSHGDHRIVEPLDAATAPAADAAWRAAATDHTGAYAVHRWELFVHLIGFAEHWNPVFDDFGDRAHLALLHHRATPSDVERGARAVVHALAWTPLFKPWLYLALAIVALYVARRHAVLRALIASGIVLEVVQLVAASGAEYRASHWLVATVWIALVASACARRWRA